MSRSVDEARRLGLDRLKASVAARRLVRACEGEDTTDGDLRAALEGVSNATARLSVTLAALAHARRTTS